MGAFTTFYTTLGGMKAVIWTDVIQFFTVVTGLALVSLTALRRINVDLGTAFNAARDAGRLRLFNFTLKPTELTSFWACLVGGSVLCLATMATDQAVLQRLFTTRSSRDAKQSIILQSIVVIPIGILLYLVGTVLFVFYHFNPGRLTGLNSDDAVMPFFAVHELPAGVSGLIIASIFAATMAVMSAGINSLTTTTIVDFYQRLFRPNETPQHYAAAGRLGTACWGGVVTIAALFAKHLGALAIGYAWACSVLSGPILGIFLLATLSTRATSGGALEGGASAGAVAVGVVSLWTSWSFFWLGPIGVLVTVVAGAVISLFTPPYSPHQIEGLVIGAGPVREGSPSERLRA